MAGTQIQFEQNVSVRADLVVGVGPGETDVLLTLPEAVPDGKVLVLNLTAMGKYVDADKAPANAQITAGTVVSPVQPSGPAKVG